MQYSRQPKLETTISPGLNSRARDSMTSPTAPPSSGLPNWKGGTYDFPSFMRPRMYGSTDIKRLRTSTSRSFSGSESVHTNVKLSAVGIPLGREARQTSRLVSLDINIISFGWPQYHLNALSNASNCACSDLSCGVTEGILRSIPSNS